MARRTASSGNPRSLAVVPLGLSIPKMLRQVVAKADEHIAVGELRDYRLMPTSFDLLDAMLSGGLRPRELTLAGGRQGVGKMIFALQVARDIAHPPKREAVTRALNTTRSASSVGWSDLKAWSLCHRPR